MFKYNICTREPQPTEATADIAIDDSLDVVMMDLEKVSMGSGSVGTGNNKHKHNNKNKNKNKNKNNTKHNESDSSNISTTKNNDSNIDNNGNGDGNEELASPQRTFTYSYTLKDTQFSFGHRGKRGGRR